MLYGQIAGSPVRWIRCADSWTAVVRFSIAVLSLSGRVTAKIPKAKNNTAINIARGTSVGIAAIPCISAGFYNS
jgi:hypothetical protein